MKQEKKLISGIDTVLKGGLGIYSYILLTAFSENQLFFVLLSYIFCFLVISIIVTLLGSYFKKAKLAVLTLAVSALILKILSLYAKNITSEYTLIMMIVSTGYIIGYGTNNYNEKLSLEWSLGAGLGLGYITAFTGICMFLIPSQRGFVFIAAAAALIIPRIIYKKL